MRFLVDECAGPGLASWLTEQGHDVLSVFDAARGISDTEVLRRAVSEQRILVTTDKDFGEMIFRQGRMHTGVILLRLDDERTPNKIDVLDRLLDQHADAVAGAYVVATEETIRIRSG